MKRFFFFDGIFFKQLKNSVYFIYLVTENCVEMINTYDVACIHAT